MRPLLIAVLTLFLCHHAAAQYADIGTSPYRNHIWWFNWAGFTVQNNASKTFTTNEGLTVQISFSNVTPHVPIPYVMNTWPGALLNQLYNFSDPTVLPALYDVNSNINFAYTLTVTATRNGLPVPFSFVTADAEASNSGETTTIQTNGSNWQTIQFYRISSQTDDPLTGCGTSTVAITNTYDGSLSDPSPTGQCPVIATQSPATGSLIIQTNFDHAGTTGGMALAFGIFEPVDRGDLPLSYGTAWHKLLYAVSNPCNYNPPYPALTQDQTLHIGMVPGDADPIQYDNDDSIGVDEEGVNSFVTYTGTGSYSVNLTLSNMTGNNAYLTGWFDFNRDGTFEPGESVTSIIPNNATSAVLTWTGLPQYLPQGSATGYGFRFRISSDQQATQNATGYAQDGEVEDYFVPSVSLCTPLSTAISADQTICQGQAAQLQISGGVTYAWSPPTGLSDPTASNPAASPQVTTLYTVTASNPQGCSAQSSVTVNVKPSPVIAISGQTDICIGKSATLTASGGTNYSWSAAGQGVIASGPSMTTTPGDSTEYYVTGLGSNGCIGADSVDVAVQPLPVFTANASQSSVCKDDSVILTAAGGDQFDWSSADGQSLGSTPSITILADTNSYYQVQIINTLCQLTSTLTVPISVKPSPVLRVTSSNDINCSIGATTLQATGGVSYQWSPATGISDPVIASPVASPLATTTYYVKGIGPNGCSSVDSVTVKVNHMEDLSRYPVPNAFSPNNDGHDDCFGLKYWGQISSLELTIYNRWGQMIFITTDPQGCWDGTYKGVPQPAGGYVYQIKAATACGVAYRKGIVILVR